MDENVFVIARIEGEYAYIRAEGSANSEEVFISMALLPIGSDVGTRLSVSNFEYRIL